MTSQVLGLGLVGHGRGLGLGPHHTWLVHHFHFRGSCPWLHHCKQSFTATISKLIGCTFLSASPSNWPSWHTEPSTAPHLYACSRVSLVLPTWRQDNGSNPQPLSDWQCRPFVSLLSASGRFHFLELTYRTIYHLMSHLHRLSRSSGIVSRHFYSQNHTRTFIFDW